CNKIESNEKKGRLRGLILYFEKEFISKILIYTYSLVMIIFFIFFTIFLNPIKSKLDDVNQIIEMLEKNSINTTFSHLKPNKIFQKNFLHVGKFVGNLSNEDKNILLKKLFLRDQKIEKLLQNASIIQKFSSHNSSKIFSKSSTLPHQTLFSEDGFFEKTGNDSNIKAIIEDLKVKSTFEDSNSDSNLIAKYKIPPLLIRANLDKQMNTKKQVLKAPRLLAKIRFRTEDLQDDEKMKLNNLNNNISVKEDNNYNIQSIKSALKNNKPVAASELTNIIDKFQIPKKQKNNKNRQKQLFHAPPEIVFEKSAQQFHNKIYNTNNKNSIYNLKKINKQNNEIISVSLQDKIKNVYNESNNFETMGNFVTGSNNQITVEPNEDNFSNVEIENIEQPTPRMLSKPMELIQNESNAIVSQANDLSNNIKSEASEVSSNISNTMYSESVKYPTLNISDVSNALNNLTDSLLSDKTVKDVSVLASTVDTKLSDTENLIENTTLSNALEAQNNTLPDIETNLNSLNNDSIVMESTTIMIVDTNSNITITTVANILNDNITATSIVTSIPDSLLTTASSLAGTRSLTLVPSINSSKIFPENLSTTVFNSTETSINGTATTLLPSTAIESNVSVTEIISTTPTVIGTSTLTLENVLSTTNSMSTMVTTIQPEVSTTGMISSMGTTMLPSISSTEMISSMETTMAPSISSTGMLSSMETTMLPSISSTGMTSSMETTVAPIISSTGMITSMETTVAPIISSTGMISSMETTVAPIISSTGMISSMETTMLPSVSSTGMVSSMETTMLPSVSSTGMVSSMETTLAPIISSTEMISSIPTTNLPGISSTLIDIMSTTPLSTTISGGLLTTTTPMEILSSLSTLVSPTAATTTANNLVKCLDSAVECESYIPLCNHTTLGVIIKGNCPLTCGVCTVPETHTCYDRFKLCSFSKFLGYCNSLFYTQEHKMKYCKETCGLC
uniref:ShKT domain-containing protein n=3 Tax=Strongyloides stercoralis TaxID=6248 RepID=A0AAF5DFE7_STRER